MKKVLNRRTGTAEFGHRDIVGRAVFDESMSKRKRLRGTRYSLRNHVEVHN
jgi:hypothetical protein